ncbi:MAG: hypothetical protein CBD74_09040 [Saprospirales bacterium TMED214]|nr:MAG: hypothetical protein CBD74_09040 [Saprospirales bacterium TMED214]
MAGKTFVAISVCMILQASRPAASTRLLAQHEAQLRGRVQGIDALDVRLAVQAGGIRCDRKSPWSRPRRWRAKRAALKVLHTPDRQIAGQPSWRAPRTTS